MDFYHSLVTDKSWQLLKVLQQSHRFILIGGWAVFLWTQALKSKDIDVVLEYEELEKLRGEFEVTKNDRLKKYQARQAEVEIDIYVPFYSNPGIPAEEIAKYTAPLAGFRVVDKEALTILKQNALVERAQSVKGRKDLLDVVSLLRLPEFDWVKYNELVKAYQASQLVSATTALLSQTPDLPELALNVQQLAKLKKLVLAKLHKET